MEEYSRLKHMSPSNNPNFGCFLPHQAVWKLHPKPKIRVVFDASHVTQSGKSLSDCLYAGQKLKADLWTVITRSRLKKIFFTTDIMKMFRQILIDPEDIVWQKILWRSSGSDKMQGYLLLTATCGTKCAPFLAFSNSYSTRK